MIRNLRKLGLLALAAFAMSAIFASAAQGAVKGMFTAGETTKHTATVLHGAQYGGAANNYFELEGSKGTCVDANVTFTGSSATGTEKSLTVTPHYKHCTVAGTPATINMNGCDYLLTQPTKLDVGEFTGKVDLVCPAGKTVVIQSFLMGGVTAHSFKLCELTLEPTNELGHIIYRNEVNGATGKDDLTLQINLEKIPYERHGACGTTTKKADGKYVSSVTVTGKDAEGNPHDLWISEEGE